MFEPDLLSCFRWGGWELPPEIWDSLLLLLCWTMVLAVCLIIVDPAFLDLPATKGLLAYVDRFVFSGLVENYVLRWTLSFSYF